MAVVRRGKRTLLASLQNLSPLLGDAAVAAAVGVVIFVWLILTANDIGVGYDEPIYGGYALKYLAWLQLLGQSWAGGDFFAPFRPEVIDLYWHAKDMHPPIPKLVAALGYALTRPIVGDDFAAMRSGTAFLFMDSPVTATALLATVALVRLLEQPSVWRLLGACLTVGMAFASKVNGFLVIPSACLLALLGAGEDEGQYPLKAPSQATPSACPTTMPWSAAFGALGRALRSPIGGSTC